MLSTTVIAWPPGFTVSWPFSATRLVEVTVIVTLAPAASEPYEGETLMWADQRRPDRDRVGADRAALAVSVNFPIAVPFTDTRSSRPVEADNVPAPGDGGAADEEFPAVASSGWPGSTYPATARLRGWS